MGFASEVAAGLPGLYKVPPVKPVIRTEEENLSCLAEAFNHAALAHVCLDMQDFYCDPQHPSNGEKFRRMTEQKAATVLDLARRIDVFAKAVRGKIPTVWVAHDHPNAFDENPEARLWLFAQRKEAMRKKLFMQAPAAEEPLVLKGGFDAFFNTDLEEQLQTRNAKAILLTGIYLHCCIDESAIGGLRRNFDVYVVETLASDLDIHTCVSEQAVQNMKRSGVKFVKPQDVLKLVHR